MLFINCLSSQAVESRVPKPIFAPFKGKVYTMPVVEKKNGDKIFRGLQEHYGENIYAYKQIVEIELAEINVPETVIGKGKFPGVDKTTQFCMVLYSNMKIELDGCYEFSLTSDDGSILWIDDKEILNNDGGHEMKLMRDTIAFDKGNYKVKLWYFQSLADRFGLQLNSKLVGKTASCGDTEIKKEIDLPSSLLFKSGDYRLSETATIELEKIADKINVGAIKQIEVIGHTDDIGDEKSNMDLSTKRAETVASALKTLLKDKTVKLKYFGRGESEPKYSNKTTQGRQANRRVQFKFMNIKS